MLPNYRHSLPKKLFVLIALGVLLLVPSFLFAIPTVHAFSNGQSAAIVIGQTSFTSGTSGATQTTLSDPEGITFDHSGNLWVADDANGRVLEFNSPLSTDEAASIVLGETSFTDTTNPCLGTSNLIPSCLANPVSLAFDSSGNLWVSDSTTNRILEFKPPFTNDENASLVLGQPDLTTGTSQSTTPTASDLNSPEGIAFDNSGNLWVADTLFNRVLEYRAPFSNGEAANVVLGQPSLTAGPAASWAPGCPSDQDCPSAQSLSTPEGVQFDSSGNLWTTESHMSRILEFKVPFSNYESASLVLGQKQFTTFGDAGGFYCSAVTPDQFCVAPYSLTFDTHGTMWVADTLNFRVVSFTPPFSTYQNESTVLGFPDFVSFPSSGIQNATSSNLVNPGSIAIDSSGNVWVADSGQNRVLEFLSSGGGGAASSTTTISQSNMPTTNGQATTETSGGAGGGTSTNTLSSSTTSKGGGGGGIPEFPVGIVTVSVFTIVIVASYLAVRKRSV